MVYTIYLVAGQTCRDCTWFHTKNVKIGDCWMGKREVSSNSDPCFKFVCRSGKTQAAVSPDACQDEARFF